MKRMLSICLAACFMFIGSVGMAAEETDDLRLEVAPLNPYYEAYLELDESEREEWIPPTMFEVLPSAQNAIMPMAELPQKYDLRDEGAVPEVRDQLDSGSCWAFAGLSSLESYLMRKYDKKYQFSPRHLEYSQVYQMRDGVNEEAFNRVADSGGSPEMLEAYLYRGAGPVEETSMPFSDEVESLYLADIDKATCDVRLMDFQYLPYDTNSQSQDSIITNIKNAVKNKGTVDININFNYAQFNADTGALYVEDTPLSNHAVSIVGWDDTFSRTNFVTDPGRDGAWIVQNSWGTDWGEEGYFYMSYAQKIIMPVVVEKAQEGKNYDNIYYHDPLGFSQFMGFVEYPGQAYAANIFDTQPGEQKLTEITIATAGYTTYQIYVNPKGNSLEQGDLQLVKTGAVDYTGYHTVALDEPLALTGTQFAIVVKYNTPGTNYGVPVERRSTVNSYYAKVEAEAGESFLSPDMLRWTEISTEENGYANCCIKAYTQNTTPRAQVTFQKSPAHARITVKKGSQEIRAQAGGLYLLEPGTYTYTVEAMEYHTQSEKMFEVTQADVVSGKKIRVTLSQGAAPPQVLQYQQEITYQLRTAQQADFKVDLGSKDAAATGIRSVLDEESNALILGRDYTFQNNTLSILSTYTNRIVLTSEDYDVLEGPTRTLLVVFNDAAQTTAQISIKFRFASIDTCLNYIKEDLTAFQANNSTSQTDVLAVVRSAYVNPILEIKYEESLTVTRATENTAGRIYGELYLEDTTTSAKRYFSVDLPIYPYQCQVKVTGQDGQEVVQLQQEQQVTVTISGTINSTTNKSHRIYMVVYDESGNMVQFRQIPQSLLTIKNNQFTVAVSVSIGPNQEIRVMAWEGAELRPLSTVAVWKIR